MKSFVCIVCPNGCRLTAKQRPNNSWEITGHTCKRGEQFGIAEMTNPTRTLTTTVRTSCDATPVLPVRTAGAIPKGLVRDAMARINQVTVHPPVRRGDIVLRNLLDTGVDLIATAGLADDSTTRRVENGASV